MLPWCSPANHHGLSKFLSLKRKMLYYIERNWERAVDTGSNPVGSILSKMSPIVVFRDSRDYQTSG